MGRLTLNVLLSFAQFEREVTAERIRDKIAASKKKGMWMGGPSPLGYNVEDRKLVIAKAEATTVRKLFDLYIELSTVRKLKEEADRLGITTKHRVQKNGKKTGGKPFSRGNLYQFLSNPLYIGKVPHKGEIYPGQHKAIIDQATWDTVQRILADNAIDRSSPTNTRAGFLLTGLSFDETGDRLTPTYANKKGRRYRYYISKRLIGSADKEERGWRLPAEDLEKTVIFSVVAFLSDEAEWIKAVVLTGQSSVGIIRLRKHMEKLATRLEISDASSRKQALEEVLESVTVKPGMISIILRRDGLNPSRKVGGSAPGYELNVPFHTKRRGVETKIIIGGRNPAPPLPDQKLIDVIRRSFDWLRLLTEEPDWSVDKLAKYASMDASDVTRFLPLAFLAPDIVEAILNGRQPIDLNVEHLKKIGPIPVDWSAQRCLLGFKNSSELGLV